MRKTAAIFLAFLALSGPAQALTVSPKVGPLLKEAQTLIAAGDYKAALAKLNEADAAKVSADDDTVIAQFRHAIAVRSPQPAQP